MVRLGLNCQDYWDGVGGPGADLNGVGRWHTGDFGLEAKGFCEGTGELGPIEFKRRDVGDFKSRGRAARRSAAAGGGDGAAGLGDAFVGAACAKGTGESACHAGRRFEADWSELV